MERKYVLIYIICGEQIIFSLMKNLSMLIIQILRIVILHHFCFQKKMDNKIFLRLVIPDLRALLLISNKYYPSRSKYIEALYP